MKYALPQVSVDKLKPHPAVLGLLPPLSEEERAALKEDIAQHGVHTALHVQEEDEDLLIIDGLNRYEICKELLSEGDEDVKWKVRVVPVQLYCYSSVEEIINHALRANLKRRHLCTGARAVIGLSLLERERRLAAERRRQGAAFRGDGEKPLATPECPQDKHEGEASVRAARAVGISSRTLEMAATAIKLMPELKHLLLECKISVHEAYKIATRERAGAPRKPQLYLVIRDPRGVELIETDEPEDLLKDKLALRADGWVNPNWEIEGQRLKPAEYLALLQRRIQLQTMLNSSDVQGHDSESPDERRK